MPIRFIVVINQNSLLELPPEVIHNQAILQLHDDIHSSVTQIKASIKKNEDLKRETALASPIREEICQQIKHFTSHTQTLLKYYYASIVNTPGLESLKPDELNIDKHKEFPLEIISLDNGHLSFFYLSCTNPELIALAKQSQQAIKRCALTATDSPSQDDLLIAYLKLLPEFSPIYTVCQATSDIKLAIQKPLRALSVSYSTPVFSPLKPQQTISTTPLLREAQEIIRHLDQEMAELQSQFADLGAAKDDTSLNDAIDVSTCGATRKVTL
jgi:hypothetical protein